MRHLLRLARREPEAKFRELLLRDRRRLGWPDGLSIPAHLPEPNKTRLRKEIGR